MSINKEGRAGPGVNKIRTILQKHPELPNKFEPCADDCTVCLVFLLTLIYLYNKTRHSYIYVAYSRLNGRTNWADIIRGHSGVVGECYRQK